MFIRLFKNEIRKYYLNFQKIYFSVYFFSFQAWGCKLHLTISLIGSEIIILRFFGIFYEFTNEKSNTILNNTKLPLLLQIQMSQNKIYSKNTKLKCTK